MIFVVVFIPTSPTFGESSDPLKQLVLFLETMSDVTVSPGEIFYVTLRVINNSEFTAKDLYIDFYTRSVGSKKPFSFAEGQQPSIEKLECRETKRITFPVSVRTDAENGDYYLIFVLEARDINNNLLPEVTTSLSVEVLNDLGKPQLIIKDLETSLDEVGFGQEFDLTISLENAGNVEAKNLVLTLDGLENFKVMDITNKKYLKKVGKNSTTKVTYRLKTDENNKGNNVLLKMSYEYLSDGKGEQEETLNLPVSLSDFLKQPRLVVTRVTLSPDFPDLNEAFYLNFDIENISNIEAKNLVVTLNGQENFEVIDFSNRKYFSKIAGKSSIRTNYMLLAKDAKKDNTVELKMSYDYFSNKNGEQIEIINLPMLRTGRNGKNPWVIINKYVLSAEKVLAGNTVTLKLFVENTNNKPVSNVKISLGVIEVEGEQGGTVFSPVNSSNSFYLDTIPGKTIIEKEIDLYVDPNAAAKTYIVPVSIKYEDINGNQLSVDELVNIPVTQESKLQIISVDLPPVGYVGQPIPVGAEFVNVGKVALNNFNVSLEGDFNKENGNYYVGNLDIGASDYFQAMIFPEQEGVLKGNLVFTYVDNNNKDVRIEYPFEIEVQQMDPAMLGPGDMGPDSPGSINGGGRKALSGSMQQIVLWGLLAVVVIETIILIKKKKKEKSGEFFDE